jgi:hypothetical protein
MTNKKNQVPESKFTIPDQSTKEYLKYIFTHGEIHEKGIELARLSQESLSLEEEKKAVVADYKAKIEAKSATINVLGNHINNGYEFRMIECTIRFNDPTTGMKSTYRNDSGELVRKDSMSSEEMQLDLNFQNKGVQGTAEYPIESTKEDL